MMGRGWMGEDGCVAGPWWVPVDGLALAVGENAEGSQMPPSQTGRNHPHPHTTPWDLCKPQDLTSQTNRRTHPHGGGGPSLSYTLPAPTCIVVGASGERASPSPVWAHGSHAPPRPWQQGRVSGSRAAYGDEQYKKSSPTGAQANPKPAPPVRPILSSSLSLPLLMVWSRVYVCGGPSDQRVGTPCGVLHTGRCGVRCAVDRPTVFSCLGSAAGRAVCIKRVPESVEPRFAWDPFS